MVALRAVWPVARWFLFAAPHAVFASADATELVGALRAAATEEEAVKIVDSRTKFDVKKIDTPVIEYVILRQWWGLARELVAKSHEQKVDLSVPVRKVVKTLKDEADELLRTLNPKYGQAQQVAPAFQWAQNDTCIFLTVKFTVRWNAPGALEVSEPDCNITADAFSFTGLGKHSNNKYKYSLALNFFDKLSPAESSWNTASVGKLSVTLRKKWARKWPRLLADKKTKIQNMHVWMEQQDRLDSALGGMSTVAHSPQTCGASKKVYCSVSDTCKANCSTCTGKTEIIEEEHLCAGLPTDRASLSFKDVDMDEHEFGGSIKISKARQEFDIDQYVVYWGKDASAKLELPDGQTAQVGEARPTGSETQVLLDSDTKAPSNASHLLVFSRNRFGENAVPGSVALKDAYLPVERPQSVSFSDEDGDRFELRGNIVIQPASDQRTIEKYAVYWGKSATKKIASSASIAAVTKKKNEVKIIQHYISDNTIPPSNGTTHILVFSSNEHGEHPVPVAVQIVDHTKPCQNIGDSDCPSSLDIAEISPAEGGSHRISITRSTGEARLQGYVLYYGKRECGSDKNAEAAMNGHIKHLVISEFPAESPVEHVLPLDSSVPEGTTHILLFTLNDWGESLFCVSQPFAAKPADAAAASKSSLADLLKSSLGSDSSAGSAASNKEL